MKTVDQVVDMGNHTNISIDYCGDIRIVYDDSDLMFSVELNARII